MKSETFKGSFYEVGLRRGREYRKNGFNLKGIVVNDSFLNKQIEVYKKYYPEILQEFKGIAKAGEYDERKLLYRFICGEVLFFRKRALQKGGACTIFGVKNSNGTFVGRNYDWNPLAENISEFFKVTLEGKKEYIAISDMNLFREHKISKEKLSHHAEDAINSEGLFIGLTFAHCDKWNHGIETGHIIRFIAENCSNVKEALQIFKKVPICGPKNFFIADKQGNIAVVEHTSKRYKILKPKQGYLIQTNHYIDKELSKEDSILYYKPNTNSFKRYNEVKKAITKNPKKIDLKKIREILLNKKSSVFQKNKEMETIWSLEMDMKKRIYRLYWDLERGKRKELKLEI